MAGRGRPKGGSNKKEEEKVVKKKTYQRCTMCGKDKTVTDNFYKSYSILFRKNYETRMCICKSCITDLYAHMYSIYETDIKSTYEVCRTLDVYFDKELYYAVLNQVENCGSSVISIYFQKANSLMQYKNKTFLQSLPLEQEEEIKDYDRINDPVLIKRWGKSYSEEELAFLEQHYSEWCERVDNSSFPIDKMIRRICCKELEVEKARINKSSDLEKKEESLTKLMDQAALTPKAIGAINENDVTKAFGIFIKDIEQYRPAEYFKNKSLYEDYDGIKEYFKRFILRPLKNLLTGTREFDKEFSISDEEEGE